MATDVLTLPPSPRPLGGMSNMAAKRNLSTFDVAGILEVDPGSVANWIDGGLLKAHRTPGGHRRVAVDDLVKFLRDHNMPVPEGLVSKGVSIVVVDDEPPMTRMIAQAIQAEHPDYAVAEAQDGFRAGSLVTMLRPDVVLLDLRMPGMDGFEVCRLIKSNEATAHATVIAMTAYPTDEARLRILECGAAMVLTKPLDMAVLMGHIEAALARARKRR